MDDVTLKFKCKITDLIDVIEKHGGVKNAVIDNNDDADGIINALVGVIGDGTFYEGCERSCIDRIGDISCFISNHESEKGIVFVRLTAEDPEYTKEFMACAKKLQKLILEPEK